MQSRTVLGALSCWAIAGCAAGPATLATHAPSTPRSQRVEQRLSSSTAPVAIDRLLQLGEEALRVGDILGARALFDRVVEREPSNPRASYYLGVVFERTGNPEEAKEWYRRAFRSDPELAEAAINLSAVLMDEKSFGEAVRVLERAVDAAPDDPLLNINLGVARTDAGDIDGALSAYRTALRVAEHPETRLSVAALLIGERRDDEALAELKRIRALSGDRRDLLATVAFLFDQIGATSDCVASLDRAIALGPDAALYVQRGLCRQHARDDKAAVLDFKSAVAFDGDNGIAHCLLAEHYARRGPYTESLASSEWCATLEQDTPLGDRAAERLRAAGRKKRAQ